MSTEICPNELATEHCARDVGHRGACRSASGAWWAQYNSGRPDKLPYSPLPADSRPTPTLRTR